MSETTTTEGKTVDLGDALEGLTPGLAVASALLVQAGLQARRQENSGDAEAFSKALDLLHRACMGLRIPAPQAEGQSYAMGIAMIAFLPGVMDAKPETAKASGSVARARQGLPREASAIRNEPFEKSQSKAD